MRHLRGISAGRRPALAALTPAEQFTLAIFAIVFQDWVNFAPVYQNLQKYYEKTP